MVMVAHKMEYLPASLYHSCNVSMFYLKILELINFKGKKLWVYWETNNICDQYTNIADETVFIFETRFCKFFIS